MFERLRMLFEELDAGGGGGAPPAKDPPPKDPPPVADPPPKKEDPPPARKSVLGGEPPKADPPPKDGDAPKFELKLPEGFKPDEKQLGEFTKWAQEKKLSPEQASDALAFYHQQQAAERAAWAAQDQSWYGELEKDPEFGKDMKGSELALQKGLKQFDTDGSLAKDLAKHGLENLPSLAKFLARVGKAGGEDKSGVDREKTAPKKLTSQERRARFYDDMKPTEKAQ